MEYSVKDALRNKRLLEAESQLLHEQLEDNRIKSNTDVRDRVIIVDAKLKRISIWLSLLTDDEKYVIQRHYMDGIDVPRIVLEYKERWGDEFAKTERTIKTYQRKAIMKICTFELQNQALYLSETLTQTIIECSD